MKQKIISYCLLSFFALNIAAQAPNGFSFQSILRNASGNTLNNQNINVRISLLEGSATGTARYTEIHTLSTNANGLINLIIGQGSNPSSDFSAIEWGKHSFYLKVETAPNGDDNYTLSTTSQLMSVPYAMHAQKVTVLENASAGDIAYFTGTNWGKLPLGKTGEVLAVSHGKPAWKSLAYEYNTTGIFTDSRDGNSYTWKRFGKQIWMTENLKATTYVDGTAIPIIEDGRLWNGLDFNDKGCCFYNNDVYTNYGALYTHAAVTNGEINYDDEHIQGICPEGWHVANEDEWNEFIDYLVNSGWSVEGRASSKAVATVSGWKNSDVIGTPGNYPETNNESKFSAPPGGRRQLDGYFNQLGEACYYWSSNSLGSMDGIFFEFRYKSISIAKGREYRDFGFSVRCIKD